MRVISRGKTGQSTLEYAILVVIVIAALLTMNLYLKGGLRGRVKSAADDIGDQFESGGMNIYKRTNTSSNTYEENYKGTTLKAQLANEIVSTYMTQNIINAKQTYWGN